MPDPRKIAAIVLAAGGSSRFGSDKLLHTVSLNNVTLPLAAHSLLPWLKTFGRVTVVVRPASQAFCAAIETALGTNRSVAIRWLVCQDAARGLATSLACGVRANADAAGWLIGLADMPTMPAVAIVGVRDTLADGADLAATSFNGRRGHPVGFSARYYEELLALRGDSGARHLLERDIARLVQTEIHDDGIFTDVDTPGDLRSLSTTQHAKKKVAT